jgi:hypothetical protein
VHDNSVLTVCGMENKSGEGLTPVRYQGMLVAPKT